MIFFPSRTNSSVELGVAGFTLLELLVVMVLLGIIMGIGVAGFDRMDPGYKGLQATVETFLESSRDQARSSGQAVVVVVESSPENNTQQLKRYVFRRALEATFEARFLTKEGVQADGAAVLKGRGRFGAGADLRGGGSVVVAGRGNPSLAQGFSLDLDLESADLKAGLLLHWEGLLAIHQAKGGVLSVSLRAGAGGQELFHDVLLQSPSGSLRAGRWQHLRLVAADGIASLSLDGQEVARSSIPSVIASPRSAVHFGANQKGWRGRIDEFTVWARVAERGPEMDSDVEVRMSTPKVTFDRYGTLDAHFHTEGVGVRLIALDEEIASFMVGRFTQEVTP